MLEGSYRLRLLKYCETAQESHDMHIQMIILTEVLFTGGGNAPLGLGGETDALVVLRNPFAKTEAVAGPNVV